MAINLLGKLTIRLGTTAQRLSVVLNDGEPGWDSQQKRLYIGDDVAAGGIPIGNICTGDNVSELANDAGYLTPGDNVSELANDAGYLTAVAADEVPVLNIAGSPYTTVQDTINTMLSPGLISGGTIEHLGAGVVRVHEGTAIIRGMDDDVSNLYFTEFPQADFNLPVDQDTKFFGVVYNAGNPIVQMHETEDFDKDTQIPLGFAVRINTDVTLVTGSPYKTGDSTVNIIQRFEADAAAIRDAQVGGLIISGGPSRTILVSSGKVWTRLADYTHTAKDSAVSGMLNIYYNGDDLVFGTSTQWDNTRYNNLNTGTLDVMDDNRYGVLWFYMAIQEGIFGYAYGKGQYTDIASAALERPPEYLNGSFRLQSLFLGRLIFRKGATAAESITSIFNLNLPFPESVSRINTFYDSSGVISGGNLSINADTTKFDVSGGIAAFMDFSIPGQPAQHIVEFGPFSAVATFGLTTHLATYVGINADGEIVQQTSPFTNTQRRSIAFLGAVIHSNLTVNNATNQIATTVHASTNQLHDLMDAIGILNLSGNVISPASTNLTVNKSAGRLFKLGCNFQNDSSNPHVISLAANTPLTFRYRLSNGTEYADTTNIDPGFYESPLGTRTTIPGGGGRFTIQRVYLFQSNLVRIQYGQAWYPNVDDALAAIFSEPFLTEQNVSENGVLIGLILVRKNATDLSDSAHARFISITKFGGAFGGGSVSTHNSLLSIQGGAIDEYYHLNLAKYNAAQLLFSGTGSPENVVTAPVGRIYMRIDGGAGSTFYVKESGTGNTGWIAK